MLGDWRIGYRPHEKQEASSGVRIGRVSPPPAVPHVGRASAACPGGAEPDAAPPRRRPAVRSPAGTFVTMLTRQKISLAETERPKGRGLAEAGMRESASGRAWPGLGVSANRGARVARPAGV